MSWVDLKKIAKWVWIAAIVLFIIFYAIDMKSMIAQALSMLSGEILLSAALLIMSAKLCLVANMKVAARRFAISIDWNDCYCIYNLTQLGKYIPGSIWQFVGRIAILRERGIVVQAIRDSLLAEHFWVITSAALIAGILLFFTSSDVLKDQMAAYNIEPLLLAILALVASVVAVALLLNRRFFHWLSRLLPPLHAIPALVLTWIFLGASLWVTLVPFSYPNPSLPYIIGIYCIAYVVGFIAPFAPAGLGIREAVLTFAMMPFINAEIAILLAAVNRLIYFAVEISAVILCIRKKTLVSS